MRRTDGIEQSAVVPQFILWHHIRVIVSIYLPRKLKLLQMIHADCGLTFGFRFAYRWQEQAPEDCDDVNDDEKFNQSEARVLLIWAAIVTAVMIKHLF
jgi:hypothetical protein